jgi:hypothetical protein
VQTTVFTSLQTTLLASVPREASLLEWSHLRAACDEQAGSFNLNRQTGKFQLPGLSAV